MGRPIVVNLPHQLGADEAKRRIAANVGKISDHIPGGASHVESSWAGNRLTLLVKAMGQKVTSHIDVEDSLVRLEVLLPAFLSIFTDKVADYLTRKGGFLLEDKNKK